SGGLARRLKRLIVVVESENSGVGKCFRHQESGRPFPAANVGDSPSRLQFLLDAGQGGNPGGYEIRRIPGAEELLTSMKNAVDVFMPSHSGAGAKGIRDPRDRRKRAQGQLKGSGQICGTVLGRHRERLLVIQAEPIVLRVISDVASRGLRCEPLAQVALIGIGAGRELRGSYWSSGQGFVESQLLP